MAIASIRSYRIGRGGTFSSTFSVRAPSEMQPGDVLFAVHSSTWPTSSMGVVGSGWSHVASANVFGQYGTRIWRRVVTSTTPTTFTFRHQNDYDSVSLVWLIAVRDADLTTPARIALLEAALDEIGLVTPGITPAASTSLEIRIGVTWTYDFGEQVVFDTPPGVTMLAQGTAFGDLSSFVAWRQRVSSIPAEPLSFPAPLDETNGELGITLSIPSASLTPPDPPPTPPFAPGRGDSPWQYSVHRLLDGEHLGVLDFESVSCDVRIGQSGRFQASLPITSETIGDQVAEIIPRTKRELRSGPGVISVRVVHDVDLWAEYWIYAASISQQRGRPPTLTLHGGTLDLYLMYVMLQSDLPIYTGVDQIEIARQLISHMQSDPRANLGLVLQPGLSGVVRDRTYLASDQAFYGQRLRELAEVMDGFEWYIDSTIVDGQLQRLWRWGYPTLGDPNAEHVFQQSPHGGDVLDWSIEADYLRGGNRWQARGDAIEGDAAAPGVPLLSTVHEAADLLAAGHPRVDRIIDRPGVKRQQTLEEYAAAWAEKYSGAPRVMSVTVRLGASPSFTPHTLGDSATVTLVNEYHKRAAGAASFSERVRVIGMGFTPSQRGRQSEAQLILAEEEVIA